MLHQSYGCPVTKAVSSAHMSRVKSEASDRFRGPACNIVEARRWETFLTHLKAFVDEHGTAAPPYRYVSADGYRLAYRTGFYRTARRLGHLAEERITVLESLNGWKW